MKVYNVVYLEEGEVNGAQAEVFNNIDDARKYMKSKYESWLVNKEGVKTSKNDTWLFAYNDDFAITVTIFTEELPINISL